MMLKRIYFYTISLFPFLLIILLCYCVQYSSYYAQYITQQKVRYQLVQDQLSMKGHIIENMGDLEPLTYFEGLINQRCQWIYCKESNLYVCSDLLLTQKQLNGMFEWFELFDHNQAGFIRYPILRDCMIKTQLNDYFLCDLSIQLIDHDQMRLL